MTKLELEECFRALSKLHEACGELERIGEMKFNNLSKCRTDVRHYREGWNDAIDFILSGGHWDGKEKRDGSDN